MNRGRLPDLLSSGLSGTSHNSSASNAQVEDLSGSEDRNFYASGRDDSSLTLDQYVTSVLKDKEACVLAISVTKIEKSSKKVKRSLFGAPAVGDARVLAICRSMKEPQQFLLHKLYPAPVGKVTRTWTISELTEVDGKGIGNGEFFLMFGERNYAFRSKAASDRSRFLWELVQTCKKTKGKAPLVRGIKLLELQEDAEKAAQVVAEKVFEQPKQDGIAEANGYAVSSPTENQMNTENIKSSTKQQSLSSKHLQTSTSDASLPSQPNETCEVEMSPKEAKEETSFGMSSDSELENGNKSDPSAGAFNSQQIKDMERQQREEARITELADLCLPEDDVADLLSVLSDVELGGSSSGLRYCDQLQEEIRELEAANLLDLIKSEREQSRVMDSLENLQNELRGADAWLGECDARLSSCALVIRDIERKMKSLEVQMDNAKALFKTTTHVLGSVTLSDDEASALDLITTGPENKLDDDVFAINFAKSPLESLAQKLKHQHALPELHEIRVLSMGREKILRRGQLVVERIDATLRKRCQLFTTTLNDGANAPGPREETVRAFAVLSAILISVDEKAAVDIVSWYEKQAGDIFTAQLLKLQSVLQGESSTKHTMAKAVDFLVPLCRKESQSIHVLFDLTADAAQTDRASFAARILNAEFHRIPQFLDDVVAARASKNGMLVYLQANTWVSRKRKQRQAAKTATANDSTGQAQVQKVEDPSFLLEMLDNFADRCHEHLRRHVDELIETSSRAAAQAGAVAAASSLETTSQSTAKSPNAPSPFAVFHLDIFGVVTLCVELMSVGRMENDPDCFRWAKDLTDQLLDSCMKNIEVVACDDSTRSLVVRIENYHCIGGCLETINLPCMQDVLKTAKQAHERNSQRCIDRILKRSFSRITDACGASGPELSSKLAVAIAEAKDEYKLANSLVQPLEENISPTARKAVLSPLLKKLTSAASDHLNRLSEFLAENGLRSEEQGLQNVRKKLDSALMQIRMAKRK